MLYRLSEENFLKDVKKKYQHLFAREFSDLQKGNDKIRIYERVNFPSWEEVKRHFENNVSVIVDKETDKVFVIETGFSAYFRVLLYAHANDLEMANRETTTMADKFISDGHGYYLGLHGNEIFWLIGEDFSGNDNDWIILQNQDVRFRVSAHFDC